MLHKKTIAIKDALYRAVEVNFREAKVKGIITSMERDRGYSGSCSVEILSLPQGNRTRRISSFTSLATLLTKSELQSLIPDNIVKYLREVPFSGCTLGSDPEIFAVDERGIIIPAFFFLPEKDKTTNGTFWDGFQAEFTTPYSGCLEMHVDDIHHRIRNLYEQLMLFNKKGKLVVDNISDIPKDMLMNAAPEHVNLGCMPSKNAYERYELRIDDPRILPIRFAGCHVHLGIAQNKIDIDTTVVKRMVKMIDAIAGVVSVSLFDGIEDSRRRIYYGRAGEYRTPKHGLEYRTLGSAVLLHPVVTHLCFGLVRAAVYLGIHVPIRSLLWKASDKDIKHAINSRDVPLAQKILSDNEKILVNILHRLFGTEAGNHALNLIYKGASHYFSTDLVENWRLKEEWLGCSGSPNCKVRSWSGKVLR